MKGGGFQIAVERGMLDGGVERGEGGQGREGGGFRRQWSEERWRGEGR